MVLCTLPEYMIRPMKRNNAEAAMIPEAPAAAAGRIVHYFACSVCSYSMIRSILGVDGPSL